MTSNEFEALYSKHQSEWHGLANKLTQNRDTAKDVIQSVMCWFCDPGRLTQLQIDENPESWIRQKIVWWIKTYIWLSPNTTVQVAAHSVSISGVGEYGGLALSLGYTPALPTYDEVEQTESPLEQAVREAIATLDVVEQDIMCMKVYAGLSIREIATILKLQPYQARDLYYEKAIPKLRLALESVGIAVPPCDGNNLPETNQTFA